jgi:hypothetical protein
MSHRLFHAVRRLGLPRLGIAATLIGAIACGDAGTGPRTPTNPTGIYGLFTVDRASIPTEIFRGTYYDQASGQSFRNFSVRVTGGEIILQDDGSFHLAVDISWATDTQTGTGTKYTDGTWEVRGSEIGLTNQVGTLVGSLRSGAITVPMDVAGSGQLKQYYFRLAK